VAHSWVVSMRMMRTRDEKRASNDLFGIAEIIKQRA
jgi:hypothetical protein